jgi:hypothetical protein
MNAALLSAVQAHDSPVMTSTVRESPPAGTMAVISVGTVSGHGSTASEGGGVTVAVDSVGVSPRRNRNSMRRAAATRAKRAP